MSDSESELTQKGIARTYLVVLTAIVDEAVASGAVESESLAARMQEYLTLLHPENKTEGVEAFVGYFIDVAKRTKRRGAS